MKVTHKECRHCNQTLEINMFKDVRRKNVSGRYNYYKHSYCHECEVKRQSEYNKTKPRREGTLSWDEYVKQKAESKKRRLESLAVEKEQRKIEREKLKQEKLKLKEKQRKLNEEAGKAKWNAWYAAYKESGIIERLQEEGRKKAEQERIAALETGVRVCGTCKEEKPLSQYHMRNRKRKDGSVYAVPYSNCKTCRRNKNRYYEHTPAGKAAKKRNRVIRDRRSRRATPKWLTPEQRKQIVDIYEHMRDCRVVTGEDYHVDHIVPLRGENVCGLHVPWNLQVLPACVNMAKSNQIEDTPYGPLEQVP